MHTTEWLTVAAVFATVFAFMMIWIMTRRAQIRREKIIKERLKYYTKPKRSTQRGGLNRRKVL